MTRDATRPKRYYHILPSDPLYSRKEILFFQYRRFPERLTGDVFGKAYGSLLIDRSFPAANPDQKKAYYQAALSALPGKIEGSNFLIGWYGFVQLIIMIPILYNLPQMVKLSSFSVPAGILLVQNCH